MITQKTKYAFKALMALSAEQQEGGSALTIEEIAERSGAPKRFLEHILLDLKRNGFIGSRRGRKGGYELIKEPKQISLGEVLRLVDGPIAPSALPVAPRLPQVRRLRGRDDLPGAPRLRPGVLGLPAADRVADGRRPVDNGTIERLSTPAVATAGE